MSLSEQQVETMKATYPGFRRLHAKIQAVRSARRRYEEAKESGTSYIPFPDGEISNVHA